MSGDVHFRVVTRLSGDSTLYIQREHFKTRDDAEAYVAKWRGLIQSGEEVLVLPDLDSRVYPFWRPNRPAQAPLTAALPAPNGDTK